MVAGSLICSLSMKVSASGIDHHVRKAQEIWTWTWILTWIAVATYPTVVLGRDHTDHRRVHLDLVGPLQMVEDHDRRGAHRGLEVGVVDRSWRLVLQ